MSLFWPPYDFTPPVLLPLPQRHAASPHPILVRLHRRACGKRYHRNETMEDDQKDEVAPEERSLELVSVIGFGGVHIIRMLCQISIRLCYTFAGSIPGGFVSHPEGEHIIYPLGCTVIVEDVQNHTQNFLCGHSNNVSCLACSSSGAFLASGQVHVYIQCVYIICTCTCCTPHIIHVLATYTMLCR